MCDLVMPDDIDTYFDIDFDVLVKSSLNLKQSWITRWQKSIYSSVKTTKLDESHNTSVM